MPIFPIPITLVRWSNRDATLKLETFIHGGRYAGRRPPRGIDPDFVSYWIGENVRGDCPPGSMMRVVDTLRFYSRADVLDTLARMLTRSETEERSFRRSLYILQAIGELGTAEQVAFAVRYFNEFLLPLPLAMEFFVLMLETAECLALGIDTGALGRRLQAALAVAGQAADLQGPEGLAWRKYSDYNRGHLPEAVRSIEARRRLALTDATARIQELTYIYMGESEFSTAAMETWAGRLLRDYAMRGGQEVVLAAFGQILDGALRSEIPKARKEFFVYRAGQAIQYLQGRLSISQELAFEQIVEGPESFLCDDLTPPTVPQL